MRHTISNMMVGLFLTLPAMASAGDYLLTPEDEIKQCLQDAREPGYEFVRQVNYISTCFAGGDVFNVDIFKVAKCRGQRCDTWIPTSKTGSDPRGNPRVGPMATYLL